jgi:hypothetical protein
MLAANRQREREREITPNLNRDIKSGGSKLAVLSLPSRHPLYSLPLYNIIFPSVKWIKLSRALQAPCRPIFCCYCVPFTIYVISTRRLFRIPPFAYIVLSILSQTVWSSSIKTIDCFWMCSSSSSAGVELGSPRNGVGCTHILAVDQQTGKTEKRLGSSVQQPKRWIDFGILPSYSIFLDFLSEMSTRSVHSR